MNVDKFITIAEKQEEFLQFPHFTRDDAWDLGIIFFRKIREMKFSMSVSLRLASGLVAFQYASEGTSLENEAWMEKKFNTVRDIEKSSLLHTLGLIKQKKTLEDRGLDPRRYVWGGGGFPIRVKGVGLVAVAVVSGRPGLEDHDTLVDCIAEYLKIPNVPHIPLNLRI